MSIQTPRRPVAPDWLPDWLAQALGFGTGQYSSQELFNRAGFLSMQTPMGGVNIVRVGYPIQPADPRSDGEDFYLNNVDYPEVIRAQSPLLSPTAQLYRVQVGRFFKKPYKRYSSNRWKQRYRLAASDYPLRKYKYQGTPLLNK